MIGGVRFYGTLVNNDQCPVMTVGTAEHYWALGTAEQKLVIQE